MEAGTDVDGHRIYVGRAFHEGDWLIAKVIPGKRATYVSYNGDEILKDNFQVITNYITSAYFLLDNIKIIG